MAKAFMDALAKSHPPNKRPLTPDSGKSSLPPPSDSKPVTSLFGGLGTSQPQQNAAMTQPTQTGGLFGNVSQPQQGGGLFGSLNQSNATQQQQSQQQGTSGGLFESLSQSQPQQNSGLFGSLGQNQNQSQQPQSTLFGGLNNQNNKPLQGFGSAQAPTPNPQTVTQPPPASIFSSQIGQYQKQQTVPGVAISLYELRPTTRFNDLHEELQKTIEYIDNFIMNEIRKQEECAAANESIQNMSLQMPSDIEYCANSLETVQQALENDAESIAFAKALVKTDVEDSKLSFKVIQNLSLPQQFHHSALRSSTMPSQPRGLLFPHEGVEEGKSNIVEYFVNQAKDMTKTLDNYNRNISEVESYLKGVESNTMRQMQQMMPTKSRDGGKKSTEDEVRELAGVLREFGNGIMGVATKVGDTREKVQEVMLGA
ncbi:structural constituent of nuclear pore [Lecanora helva]